MNCFRLISRQFGNSSPTVVGLKNVGIIGVPFEGGQKLGTSVGQGPAKLREAGLIEALKAEGVDVKDYGDLKTSNDVSETCKNVSEAVQKILQDNRLAITLGGDHSIGTGTVYGNHKYNKDTVVVWVDAHADINTRQSSLSGNDHGMPLSKICKEFADDWKDEPHIKWTGEPTFSTTSLAYIGLRSVDHYESKIIEKLNIANWSMEAVDKIGPASAAIRSIRSIDPEGLKPIHVSFDIDALDPSEAPSTILPIRGGLTYREGITIMETFAATGRLQAFDLVEIYPSKGNEKDLQRTLDVAIALIKAASGITRSGIFPVRDNKLTPLNPLKPF